MTLTKILTKTLAWLLTLALLTSTMPLTALASADSPYTVTWNTNGGTPEPTQTSVTHGGTITAPTAPTKTGSIFGGWYADENLTTPWDFDTDIVTEDITLYARWIVNVLGGDAASGDLLEVTIAPNGGVILRAWNNDAWQQMYFSETYCNRLFLRNINFAIFWIGDLQQTITLGDKTVDTDGTESITRTWLSTSSFNPGVELVETFRLEKGADFYTRTIEIRNNSGLALEDVRLSIGGDTFTYDSYGSFNTDTGTAFVYRNVGEIIMSLHGITSPTSYHAARSTEGHTAAQTGSNLSNATATGALIDTGYYLQWGGANAISIPNGESCTIETSEQFTTRQELTWSAGDDTGDLKTVVIDNAKDTISVIYYADEDITVEEFMAGLAYTLPFSPTFVVIDDNSAVVDGDALLENADGGTAQVREDAVVPLRTYDLEVTVNNNPTILLNGTTTNATLYDKDVIVSVDRGTLTITINGAPFRTDVAGPVTCSDPGLYVVTAVDDAGNEADPVTFSIALVAEGIVVNASALTELIYGTALTDALLSGVTYRIQYTNGSESNPIPVTAGMCSPTQIGTVDDIGDTVTVTVTFNNGIIIFTDTFKIIVVDKDDQTGFGFASPTQVKTYGDAPFTVSAAGAVLGSTVSYASSTPAVATVNSLTGQVTIVGAGTTTIEASATETAGYKPAAASYTLTVGKADLTVKPKDFNIFANAAMPTPEVEYVGLQYNDTSALLTLSGGSLDMEIRNAADDGALEGTGTPGTYKIIFTGSPEFNPLNNYNISTADGTLSVTTPAPLPPVPPEPIPSPDPQPSVSPSPSPSAEPSPSPSPSAEPSPSPSAAPSPTPEATPEPEASPTPSATPAPEAMPTPSATPTPEASPTPEPESVPLSTPAPESSPTPMSSPVPQTLPANDGAVAVSFTQSESGGEVILSLPEEAVAEIIQTATDGIASFDLSTATGATALSMPRAALADIVDAGLGVEVKLPQGSINLDNAALAAVGQAGGADVSMTLLELPLTDIPSAQRENVREDDLVFHITITSGAQNISTFGGGLLAITLPYAGETPVAVWHLGADGELARMESVYDEESETVTFYTPHLSMFVVGYDDEAVMAVAGDESDMEKTDDLFTDAGGADDGGLLDASGGIGGLLDSSVAGGSYGGFPWGWFIASAVLLVAIVGGTVVYGRRKRVG